MKNHTMKRILAGVLSAAMLTSFMPALAMGSGLEEDPGFAAIEDDMTEPDDEALAVPDESDEAAELIEEDPDAVDESDAFDISEDVILSSGSLL